MPDSRFAKSALIAILIAGVAGCTVQDRYNAMRRENVVECNLKLTEVERERCREQLPPATYEDYERLRNTVPNRVEGARRLGVRQPRGSGLR